MVKPSSAGRPFGQQVAGGRTRCTLLLVEQKPASSRRDQDLTPNPGDFSPQPAPCLGGCLPFSGSVRGVKSTHTPWQAIHKPAQSGKSPPPRLARRNPVQAPAQPHVASTSRPRRGGAARPGRAGTLRAPVRPSPAKRQKRGPNLRLLPTRRDPRSSYPRGPQPPLPRLRAPTGSEAAPVEDANLGGEPSDPGRTRCGFQRPGGAGRGGAGRHSGDRGPTGAPPQGPAFFRRGRARPGLPRRELAAPSLGSGWCRRRHRRRARCRARRPRSRRAEAARPRAN